VAELTPGESRCPTNTRRGWRIWHSSNPTQAVADLRFARPSTPRPMPRSVLSPRSCLSRPTTKSRERVPPGQRRAAPWTLVAGDKPTHLRKPNAGQEALRGKKRCQEKRKKLNPLPTNLLPAAHEPGFLRKCAEAVYSPLDLDAVGPWLFNQKGIPLSIQKLRGVPG